MKLNKRIKTYKYKMWTFEVFLVLKTLKLVF